MNITETLNSGTNATVTETVTQWVTKQEFEQLVNQVKELQQAVSLQKEDEWQLRGRVCDLEDNDIMDNQVEDLEKRISKLESEVSDIRVYGLEN